MQIYFKINTKDITLKLNSIKVDRKTALMSVLGIFVVGLAYLYQADHTQIKNLNDRVAAAESAASDLASKNAALSKLNADYAEKFKSADELFTEKEQELETLKAQLGQCSKPQAKKR